MAIETFKKRVIFRTGYPWVFSLGFGGGLIVAISLGWMQPLWVSLAGEPSAKTAKTVKTRPALQSLRTQASRTDRETVAPAAAVSPRETQAMGDLAPYFTLTQAVGLTRQRLERETTAEANFKRAKELAVQGIAVRDGGRTDGAETLSELQHQEYLWEAALQQLDQIPPESLFATLAAERRSTYADILAPVAADIDQFQSAFLTAIAEKTRRPQAIRITICHLSGECRDYKGDVPPASPASLIKLPVAVVLLHKVTTESIDLDTSMYIDPHNWTENANGAKIYVRNEYPIREVMVRMIKESNNIATNQLADYLGWDYLNQTLADLGYTKTKFRSKLIGDRTAPTKNRSVGSNTMTTNEVTEMMRQIYTFTNPGDDEILDALVGQYDWDFGYAAINQLRNKRVAWIGEKTGQNSKVIGSSLAVKIDDERYVMTVTIDHSANQRMLRQVIGDVVQAILDEGHLVRTAR